MTEVADQLHPSHVTRYSDASSFDEICINCGATDLAGAGWGQLRYPCESEPDDHRVARSLDAATTFMRSLEVK